MGGEDITSVELVEKWVYKDLQSGFTAREQEEILDDLDDLEDQLTVWSRSLPNAVDILNDVAGKTVYRRRQGGFRSYLIRQGDTLYCIGIGKRDTTYERDLKQIEKRADSYDPENKDE
ncbi:MAG: hypothetical protein SV253_04645 [Halobacteria archaeon]|nr:hypothetical protein [Halobacteria archaeon]